MTRRWRHGVLCLGLLAGASMGCGGLLGEEGEDDALFSVEGTLVSAESLDDARREKLRVALHWEHWPEATAECMKTITTLKDYNKCLRLSPSSAYSRQGVDVKVKGRFPNTFDMPVRKLPEPGLLNGDEGAKFGLAYVLAYVDGNGNGRLDPVSRTATSSPDEVIGHQEGYTLDALVYHYVVYREGALHPFYNAMFPQCPEPPQGYSLVSYRYKEDPALPPGQTYFDGCDVDSGRVKMDLFIELDGRFRGYVCEHNTSALRTQVRAATATPPPSGSETYCRNFSFNIQEPALYVNRHPERYCVSANTEVYTLRDDWDGTWDDRATPPAWWPCATSTVP